MTLERKGGRDEKTNLRLHLQGLKKTDSNTGSSSEACHCLLVWHSSYEDENRLCSECKPLQERSQAVRGWFLGPKFVLFLHPAWQWVAGGVREREEPGVFLGVGRLATVLVAEMLLTLTRVGLSPFSKLQDTMFSMVIGITGKRKSSSTITYFGNIAFPCAKFSLYSWVFY